ncbi:FxLD family lanthipeptide [Virgisporangium aliadipatigenens]|uniref:FxLD family lanthipeptide n=1 Tax=Virgisporangium aliadipatigenens TaxID=741659 RepID=UPI00194087DD|nr:FxLD family lanthipeptide [Virgisporangium aliadipatigenens]
MPVPATPTSSPASSDIYPEFDLDVQITTDAEVGYSVRRCDTSDGCAATCASSCASS